MTALVIILKVLYFLVSISLVVVVLTQKGKAAGLSGAIGGAGETYWGKNKARSMEGALGKITVALAAGFIILALLINILG